jgi:hypothetical protein
MMNQKSRIFCLCFTLAFCLSPVIIHAQILKDSTNLNLVKKDVDYIYNFQFDKAKEVLNKINQSCPGHPIVSLLGGMIIYWEKYPLLTSSRANASFESEMHNCINLCETKMTGQDEPEYLLINLCARCMLLMYYTDNDLTSEVFPLTLSTYKHLKRSFNFTSVYSDFYFFTGIYNYYREAYPEAFPVYRTMAFLFPRGGKIKGLKQLQTAANTSIFLKADAYAFLSGISIDFENNYQNAEYYNELLCKLYPDNIMFLALYIKNLFLLKRYDEAEELIKYSETHTTNSLYQTQMVIFKGLLQEKKYHNINKALEYYKTGVRDISEYGTYCNDFASYAYFGLSRISEISGDKRGKKIYRKKALELSDYKKVNFDD